MNDIQWIFDGIGTTIISFIVGAILGSGITYKITAKKHIKTSNIQKSGKNSTQIQVNHNEK